MVDKLVEFLGWCSLLRRVRPQAAAFGTDSCVQDLPLWISTVDEHTCIISCTASDCTALNLQDVAVRLHD